MKIFAPSYYKDFVCIADRCTHSCCIGWEIDIDEKSAEKYASFSREGYEKRVRDSIDFSADTPCFKLSANDRCPHLNERNLCNIILELGESCLCDICREHPRFYHTTKLSREVGVGMACEAACELILKSDDYKDFIYVGESDDCSEYESEDRFDPLICRQKLFDILSDPTLKYTEKLHKIYTVFRVQPLSSDKSKSLFSSLEYLDKSHQELFSCYSSSTFLPDNAEKLLERALAYFVFRHCSDAYNEDEFRMSLFFALTCERLFSSLLSTKDGFSLADAVTFGRIISEELEYSEDNTDTIKFYFLTNTVQ